MLNEVFFFFLNYRGIFTALLTTFHTYVDYIMTDILIFEFYDLTKTSREMKLSIIYLVVLK